MSVFGCYAAFYVVMMNNMILNPGYVSVPLKFVAMKCLSTLTTRPSSLP
jgi:hypothetical protein